MKKVMNDNFPPKREVDPNKILKIIADKRFQVVMVALYVTFEVFVALIHKAKGGFGYFATYYSVHILFFYLYCLVALPAALNTLHSIYKPIVIMVPVVSLHILCITLIHAAFFLKSDQFWDCFQLIYIVNSAYRVSQVFLISFIIWGGLTVIKVNLHQRALENNYLYARINPHFLHNCLNMIHSAVNVVSTDAGRMITDLSNFSRAAMRELDQEGRTRLGNELEMVYTLIRISKLRMEKDLFLKIDTNLRDEDLNKMVPPQIFVPLVENVIKHGVVTDPAKPAEISIKYQNGKLRFTSFNYKMDAGYKLPSYNIGLDNVRRRLENLYGHKFEMSISDTDVSYYLSFTLPI